MTVLQLTDKSNESFSGASKYTSMLPSFTVSIYRSGGILWRVRTFTGNNPGPWSITRRCFINSDLRNLAIASSNPVPLSLPYSYIPATSEVTARITLATDANFTQVVYQKLFPFTKREHLVGMLENLQPNTQYFIKAEDVNEGQNLFLPFGVLSRVEFAFNTSSKPLSPQWTFINSSTHATIQQGSILNFVPTPSANWIAHAKNGLVQLDKNSLTLKNYNRDVTNGKIGNVNLLIGADEKGTIHFNNTLSTEGNFINSIFGMNQLGEFDIKLDNIKINSNYKLKRGEIFTGFNPRPLLLYTNTSLYSIEKDSVKKIFEPQANRYVPQWLVLSNTVWMLAINSSNSKVPYELIEFDIQNKTSRTFTYENTPQLNKYFTEMIADSKGNVWVSQWNDTHPFSPLAKFDGQSWVNFRAPLIPINNNILRLANDYIGNIYAVESNFSRSLYKYDGQNWKKLTDIPFQNPGKMIADERGNLWFTSNFQLARFNPCNLINTPKITSSNQMIEISEAITLKAEGCLSAIWSWSSTAETVTGKLIQGTNQLIVNPITYTTYRARCYEDGCSGNEAQFAVTVLPKLALIRTNKNNYCPGDELTATISLQGNVEASNRFSLLVKSGTQSVRYPATGTGTSISANLPSTISPGQYVIYAETSQPAVRSRDSVQITVVAPPTAELSSSKPGLTPGDSARISVALSGTAPWRFMRWDGQPVQSPVSPYSATFRSDVKPTAYNLTVSNLSDAVCPVGTVKNSLTISLIVLATEPNVAECITVYPNPTSSIIKVVTSSPVFISALELSDSHGRKLIQRSFVKPLRQYDFDVSNLPTSAYFLRIETSEGNAVIWKVLKQN